MNWYKKIEMWVKKEWFLIVMIVIISMDILLFQIV